MFWNSHYWASPLPALNLGVFLRRKFRFDSAKASNTVTFCSIAPANPDNGAEFTVKRVRGWLSNLQIKPLFIEPGSPWDNGFIESFNGRMRDELLNGEIFFTLKEAEILIEMWRKEYNTVRPHSALGYRPPVQAAIMVPTTQFQPVGLT